MDFFLKLKGYKKYYGMDVSLMKGDETLDTITISDDEGSGKKLTFETEESKEGCLAIVHRIQGRLHRHEWRLQELPQGSEQPV